MPELAILHVCPHCGRVFDSPSYCVAGECSTESTPMVVPTQTMRRLLADPDALDEPTPVGGPADDVTEPASGLDTGALDEEDAK